MNVRNFDRARHDIQLKEGLKENSDNWSQRAVEYIEMLERALESKNNLITKQNSKIRQQAKEIEKIINLINSIIADWEEHGSGSAELVGGAKYIAKKINEVIEH